MQSFHLPGHSLYLTHTHTLAELRNGVGHLLDRFAQQLPPAQVPLLIKPCLGLDRPALLGGSSDFRLLAALFDGLKARGFHTLALAESALPGYHRAGVKPWRRLRAEKLLAQYGVKLLEVGLLPSTQVDLPAGPVRVLREALEWPMILVSNVRTHPDLGLAMGAWNLKGLVHPEDRAQLMRAGGEGLLALVQRVQPRLSLLDLGVVMEGEGPLDGTPRRLDRLLGGEDVLALDLLATRLLGYTPEEVPTLWKALHEQVLLPEAQVWLEEKVSSVATLRRLRVQGPAYEVREVVGTWMKGMLRRRSEAKGWQWMAERLSVRHVVQAEADPPVRLRRTAELCGGCRRCEDFCPVGLKREEIGLELKTERCVECLYCYQVCDRGALRVEGERGPLLKLIEAHKSDTERL